MERTTDIFMSQTAPPCEHPASMLFCRLSEIGYGGYLYMVSPGYVVADALLP